MANYELDEAAMLFGREAARHGDWAEDMHRAAVELFEAVATLDDRQPHFVITCNPGSPHDPVEAPSMHFDLGDVRATVTYADAAFSAVSEDGTRHNPFELAYNGCLRAFESTQEVAGKRRDAAAVLVEAVIANLRGSV